MTTATFALLCTCTLLLSGLAVSSAAYFDPGFVEILPSKEEIDHAALAEVLAYAESDPTFAVMSDLALAHTLEDLEDRLSPAEQWHLTLTENISPEVGDELEIANDELSGLAMAEAEAYMKGGVGARRRTRARRRYQRPRPPSPSDPAMTARMARLEREVRMLRSWVAKLAKQLEDTGPKPPRPTPRPTPKPVKPVKPKPDNPAVVACGNKTQGSTCEFKGNPAAKLPYKGKCTAWKTDDTITYCQVLHPAAYACLEKKQGDSCSFLRNPYAPGSIVNGTCSSYKDTMYCNSKMGPKPPAPAPGPKPDKPPHVASCEGKLEGNYCEYRSKPDWPLVKGQCTSYKDSLFCKKVPEPIAACLDKKDGEKCGYLWNYRKMINGTCMTKEFKHGNISWCHVEKPTPDEHPAQIACTDKEKGSACEFSVKEHVHKGTCTASLKDDKLFCKTVAPHVAACVNKSKDDGCEWQVFGKYVRGSCKEAKFTDPPTLYCQRTAPVPPHMVACKGKEEGEACEFAPRPGHRPLKGECVKGKTSKGDTTWCRYSPPGQRRRRDRRRRRRSQTK